MPPHPGPHEMGLSGPPPPPPPPPTGGDLGPYHPPGPPDMPPSGPHPPPNEPGYPGSAPDGPPGSSDLTYLEGRGPGSGDAELSPPGLLTSQSEAPV